MLRLYEESELGFALLWIGIYLAGGNISDTISGKLNTGNSISTLFLLLAGLVLFIFLKKNGLEEKYGLCKPAVGAKYFLWYIPLIIITGSNLWAGAVMWFSPSEMIVFTVKMLAVGFMEEMIFRGLLFKAMCRSSIKRAVIVSSLTFGIGHVLNLFNGSGMNLAANIMQIICAVAIGLLYVLIFYRGRSIVPCVLSHGIYNSLSAFNAGALTGRRSISVSLIEWALIIAYILYLLKCLPKEEKSQKRF